jgi:hypothetical protein
MKNKRGRYRVRIKKWYGWSWVLGAFKTDTHGPDVFETDSFQGAEDYVHTLMEAKGWADKAKDWSLIREMEG